MFFKEKKKEALIGFIMGLIFIPLMLLPFMPFDTYKYFIFNQLPDFSAFPLAVSPMNQSLISFIMSFSLPYEKFATWETIIIPDYIKLINTLFGLVSVSALTYLGYKSNKKDDLFYFAAILALAPIIAYTGWEAVYVLVLPLIYVSYINFKNANLWFKSTLYFCIFMFLIPKPPDSIILKFANIVPGLLQNLFYSRFMFCTIILIVINLFVFKKGGK